MSKNIGFIILFSIISFFTSCEILGLVEKEKKGFKDQVLSGEIRNQSFSFVSGVARDSSYNNTWQISLYPTNPDSTVDAWDSNAYFSSYQYLVFSILKD